VRLDLFFDELFTVLDAADIGLTVPNDGPGVRATPPAPYVMLPAIDYQSPGPGLHAVEDLVVTVVFGPANNAEVFRTALRYASTSGDRSLWAAIRGHTWTNVGTLFIRRAEPNIDTVRDSNPQIAYDFHMHITGG
jgi:hypothetical protein